MSATDFRPGRLIRKKSSRVSLVQHLKRDRGRASVIFQRKGKVTHTRDITFTNINPLTVNERIKSLEVSSSTKFRGWKTNFQPQSHGTRIFLVFS